MDSLGESPRLYSGGSELGVYYNDTRYLGIWEMVFNGMSPVALSRELRFGGSTVVFSMTNRDFESIGGAGRIPRDTFLIRRILTLYRDTFYETVEIKNFDSEAHSLQIEQWSGGKFDDVFEVRGFARSRRGRMLATEERELGPQSISILQYQGLDGITRKTFVHRLFRAEKVRVSPSLVGYFTRIEVPPKKTVLLKTIVSFESQTDGQFAGHDYESLSVAEKMQLLRDTKAKSQFDLIQFESDNSMMNRSLLNAQTDISMLLTLEDNQLVYPYAGIPWFSAPFGRDGMITAYQLLPWYPHIAKGVIEYAIHLLGSKVDPFTDEQPGKIFHEKRRGEMCNTREVPFLPYYGSVDSTPLFLILLHEYIRWTLDKDQLKKWWPEALRAMAWIEKWGDADGDGFLEYSKQSPSGLVNQGWKDSHDSIMHENGILARPPIRLCEVQGYAFRARMAMSSLAHFLGKDDLATRFRKEALELRSRFTEKFWDSAGQYFYLALDGQSQPCAVKSSNMGHCLWSQICTPEQARAVTRHLMSDSMFSGFGIRTLDSGEVAYNPLSYHNGSVWPHDNSMILEGYRLYGQLGPLEALALGLIGVLEASDDYRLPELFCGFRRRGDEPPIPYEVACKPQAWAAGSIFLMLKAILGLSTDVDLSYVVFNSPLLTKKMNFLEIKKLRGRDWEMDFAVRRTQYGTSVEVTRKVGNLRVLTVR